MSGEKFDLTDLGNAIRFARDHVAEVRYTKQRGWLHWDGRRWAVDETGSGTHSRAVETLRKMKIDGAAYERANADDKYGDALVKWAIQSQALQKTTAMIKGSSMLPSIATTIHAFDTDPWMFNVANGTIDLRTGKLGEHRCADMITKLSPVEFDASAACPLWERFLEEIQPDADVRKFLQRAAGYSLTGVIREAVFMLLWGEGSNGKSVLIEILRAALGEYASVAPTSVIMDQAYGESHPTDVAGLVGARFASAAETRKDRRLASEKIKNVTGGECVTARLMMKDFFEFRPTFKLWLSTNHVPKVDDDSDGIWRRLKKVDFVVKIEGDRIDTKLPEKLRAELPGILNWLIAGCLEWQSSGLAEPKQVVTAGAAYRDSQDIVKQFLDERCVAAVDASVPKTELYSDFSQWHANVFGHRAAAMSAGSFGQYLGPKYPGSSKRKWSGVRLKTQQERTIAAAVET